MGMFSLLISTPFNQYFLIVYYMHDFEGCDERGKACAEI